MSPYNYCGNNPLTLKDPSGKAFGGPLIQTTMTSEGWSYKTERKARSVGDAPHGSSHLEESFKGSLQAVARTPGVVLDLGLGALGLGWTAYCWYGEQRAKELARQQEAEAAMVPAAANISIGGNVYTLTGGSYAENYTMLFKGEDAMEVVSSSTYGYGGGFDVSGGISITLGWYFGNNRFLTANSLMGEGTAVNIGGSALGYFGLTSNRSPSDHGVWIFHGISIGGSATPTVVNGSILHTTTTPVTILPTLPAR